MRFSPQKCPRNDELSQRTWRDGKETSLVTISHGELQCSGAAHEGSSPLSRVTIKLSLMGQDSENVQVYSW